MMQSVVLVAVPSVAVGYVVLRLALFRDGGWDALLNFFDPPPLCSHCKRTPAHRDGRGFSDGPERLCQRCHGLDWLN